MTFSIAARCAQTGMLGMAVSSSSPAVAARCAFARAGVGAAASQNITDPNLGPRLLDLMETGVAAPDAIRMVADSAPNIAYRQMLAIDARGRTGAFSGANTLGLHAVAHGDHAVAGGNILKDRSVPGRMVEAFAAAQGALADRLLAAMQAAIAAGGEQGPVHSAGLLVVRELAWPIVNLRIDWTDGDPIGELERLWRRYEPQLEDYVTRANNPGTAPSFGVPGNR